MGRTARKRKLQIRKKRSWSKIILSSVAILIGLIVLLLAVGWIAISSFLSGDDFKALLEKQAAKKMEVATVSIAPLEWGGSSLATKSLKAEGNEIVQLLEISNLEANINRSAIFDRHFEISNIQADSISIHLAKANKTDKTAPPSNETVTSPIPLLPETANPSRRNDTTSAPQKDIPLSSEKTVRSSSWLKDHILPTKYSLGKASINKVDLIYEDDTLLYSVKNVKLTITPELSNQEYRILLQGGEFTLPSGFASKGTIQSALLRYRSDRMSASDFRITLDNGGYLDIEGEYSFPDKSWWTSLVARDIKCSDLLPSDWKQKIGGVIQGTARIRKDPGETPNASGSVKIDKGSLTAIPILDTMAAFTGTSKFRNLQFNKAEANYEYQDETIDIKDIIISSEGLLRIEGQISIDENKNLKGQLKVGVLPGILSSIPGAEEKVFLSENNQGKLGLLWANVNLSGTLDHPREDLSARLITAAGERLFRSLPGRAEKALLFSGTLAERLLGHKKQKAASKENPASSQEGSIETPPEEAIEKIEKPVDKTINSLIKASKMLGL